MAGVDISAPPGMEEMTNQLQSLFANMGKGKKKARKLKVNEGLNIQFQPEGIKRLAEIAWQVNEKTENIGARRLHTLLERLLEEVSFSAGDLASAHSEEPIRIDADYVNSHLGELAENEDLSRYIL